MRAWTAAGATLVALAGLTATAAATTSHVDRPARPDRPGHGDRPDRPGHGDRFDRAIEAIMNKPNYAHAQWALLEVDPESGKVIHSQFPNQFFIPGSDTKLVTISAAWHTLGPDHRFTTPVYSVGTLNGSTLTGNLALVAQGDLTMGGRTRPDGTVDYTNVDHTSANELPGATLTPEDPLAGIDQIAQQVHDAGITRVDGDVIIDPRLFTPPPLDPQPTPLIINDNLIDLLTTPTTAGQPAQLMWRPQVAPYNVTSTVQTVAAGGPTNITVSASPDGTRITVSGTVAADSQPVLRVSPIKDPNAFGRTALIEALGRAGVTVTAPPTGPNPQDQLPAGYGGDPRVAAYVSPPYSQYAKLILKVSHNLGANLALCNMATFEGRSDCFDGFPIERDFLQNVAHVDPTQFQLEDGRGCCASERATPIGLAQILAYWLTTPDADAFRHSLPILGVDGSNAGTCTDCPAKGKVFAKPGTVVSVDLLNDNRFSIADQSQAGYLQTDDGRLLVFVLMMNAGSAPDINGVVDVFNDSNEITALLQQQASRNRNKPRWE
jgi:D-alanyl-D-alanine carboxypeptidase/D-alanyl-D-alanine-endopeptidase (penicillin-binding protein 4)